jgi:L-lactate dehydrogenase (cytochrome)
MARDIWFETVAIAQQRAKKRLPKSVYSALIAASEKGLTVADNVEAFGELGFAPHVIGASEKRDLSTTVMGQEISLPVLISPTGVQAVHPDGEVAVARAAAARGTAMGLSSFASKPIEDVIAANPKLFFQVYWLGGRDAIAARVERARAAGAVGLIVTTDWSFSHGRDWGSPKIPENMDVRTIVRMMPEGLTRPRWMLQWAKTMRPPNLRVPNQASLGRQARRSSRPTASGWHAATTGRTSPGCENCGRTFMLKGVMRIDDAKRAVDAGVSAISVSNHGGNNLDGTPASIRALGPIVDAVGSEVEVLLDGGIRRGSDVIKALALGPARHDRSGLPLGSRGRGQAAWRTCSTFFAASTPTDGPRQGVDPRSVRRRRPGAVRLRSLSASPVAGRLSRWRAPGNAVVRTWRAWLTCSSALAGRRNSKINRSAYTNNWRTPG